jgi:Lar family restriction alleviation protein
MDDFNMSWQPDVPAAQPQPEPELMTGPEAVIAAMKQGGGEVWNVDDNEIRLIVMPDGSVQPLTMWSLSSTGKLYTVRPLAPALLPCPFCGGTGKVNKVGGEVFVVCDPCGATGKICKTEAESIDAWNWREGSET